MFGVIVLNIFAALVVAFSLYVASRGTEKQKDEEE